MEGMMAERIEVRVGGIGLSLSRAEAAALAAQLAQAGFSAEATVPDGVVIIGNDHPMWELHSGGPRHSGPDWSPGDEELAQTQTELPPLTAAFHRALVDHPGQLLTVHDLARLTDGKLLNARVVAGALRGYVQWCERLDRRFPFFWWEGRNGQATRYAMQPRVADLFRSARGGEE
jgi:hypothetical protein